jgi:hypothetical protein
LEEDEDALAGVENGVAPPKVKGFAGVDEDEGVEVEAPKVKPEEAGGAGVDAELEGVEGVNENPPAGLGCSSFFSSTFFSLASFSSSFFFPSSPFAIDPKLAPNENPLLGFVGSSVFFLSESFPLVAVEVVAAGEVGGETL